MSTQAADIDASKAPLLAHLTELRRRLLYCLGLFLVAFVVAYYFADYLFGFLTQPLVEAFGNSEDRRMAAASKAPRTGVISVSTAPVSLTSSRES